MEVLPSRSTPPPRLLTTGGDVAVSSREHSVSMHVTEKQQSPVQPTLDPDRCRICNDDSSVEGNAIVYCEKCGVGCHQLCYGVESIPEGDWFCKPCADGYNASEESCRLCSQRGGLFARPDEPLVTDPYHHKARSGAYIHVECGIWIPGVEFRDPDKMDLIHGFRNIDPERLQLQCSICKLMVGACIQCDDPKCFKSYHPSCAVRSNYDMEMQEAANGIRLVSHCPKHDKRKGSRKFVIDLIPVDETTAKPSVPQSISSFETTKACSSEKKLISKQCDQQQLRDQVHNKVQHFTMKNSPLKTGTENTKKTPLVAAFSKHLKPKQHTSSNVDTNVQNKQRFNTFCSTKQCTERHSSNSEQNLTSIVAATNPVGVNTLNSCFQQQCSAMVQSHQQVKVSQSVTFSRGNVLGNGANPMISDVIEEDGTVCSICNSGEVHVDDEIIICEICEVACHQSCYGVAQIPSGPWYCKPCSGGLKPSELTCELCGKHGGALSPSVSTPGQVATWAHSVCVLWVPGVTFTDPIKLEGFTGVANIDPKRKRLRCSICKVKGFACIQCTKGSCPIAFHPSCAIKSPETKMRLEAVPHDPSDLAFVLLCPKHTRPPEQKKTSNERKKTGSKKRGRGRPKGSSSMERIVHGSSLAKEHQFDQSIRDDSFVLQPRPRGRPKKVRVDPASIGIDRRHQVISDAATRNERTKHTSITLPRSSKVATCGVCQRSNSSNTSRLIHCATCGVCVHNDCYGISTSQLSCIDFVFQCDSCAQGLDTANISCRFCPTVGGQVCPMIIGTNKVSWSHAICAYWHPNVDVIEPNRWVERQVSVPSHTTNKSICCICHIPHGQCVKCDGCDSQYHPSCALINNFVIPLTIDRKPDRSYCSPMHEFRHTVQDVEPTPPAKVRLKLCDSQTRDKSQFWKRFIDDFQKQGTGNETLAEFAKSFRQRQLQLVPPTHWGTAKPEKKQNLDDIVAAVVSDVGHDTERYVGQTVRIMTRDGELDNVSAVDALTKCISACLQESGKSPAVKGEAKDKVQALSPLLDTDTSKATWQRTLERLETIMTTFEPNEVKVNNIDLFSLSCGVSDENETLSSIIERTTKQLTSIQQVAYQVQHQLGIDLVASDQLAKECRSIFAKVRKFRTMAADELATREAELLKQSQDMRSSCSVCSRSHSEPGNVIVYCDGCPFSVHHRSCYGVQHVPVGEWFCSQCLKRRASDN